MAIEDAGLLNAVAQWVSVVGVPGLLATYWRMVQWQHKQDLAIADLQSQMREHKSLRQDVNDLAKTLQQVHLMLQEVRTDVKYMDRRSNAGDRRNEPRD